MTKKLIRRIVWVTLPLLLAGSGCKEKEKVVAPKPPEVEVVAVQQRDVPIYRDWVGTLEGDVNATISAQVSGYLISRNYDEGSAVTNGQVLFQIDPATFRAALDKAKAQMDQAIAQRDKYALDVKRYRPLAATEAISKQELDDAIQNEKTAQAEVEADKAAVEQAQLNLNFTTIRSPLDGVAGLAKAQVGDLLGPSTGQLTTVTKIEPIRAYFSISQQLMTQLQESRIAEGRDSVRSNGGPELELILASGTVYPIKGRVRFANNQVDVKTGTITVVGEFTNPQMLLVPGMFVRVRALLDTEKNALLVPQRAVTEMQGQYLVAVVGEDNKVSIRPVEAGERIGQQWVITGKVKAGDRVVAEGIQKVRDGATVNPVPFNGNAAPTSAAPAPKAKASKE
ncbi:MAG: efflux RND transporter periplasmic adaptor subunit [Verrucomicrobiota bacterium]|nr:efflux RND transporter periplasmic adaptor subunit [Verrucomicrobiota bacterium]